MKMVVFIFGAGGRQVLPVAKGFHDIGCTVVGYCGARLDTGYLSRFIDERILFPMVSKEGEDFYDCGARLIRENNYDLVVPLGDLAASYLAQRKEELSRFTKIAVNDWDKFQYAIDKGLTMKVCSEQGVSAPKTLIGDDVNISRIKEKLPLPFVIKPRTGLGSIGFNIFRSYEAAEKYLLEYKGEHGPLLAQEYINQGKHPQYRADLFRDSKGCFKACCLGKVTRWYPLDGGSGIYAETIHNEQIEHDCKALLDAINWNGYANIDLVWDEKEGKAKIIEINGRTGASIKIDYAAGINVSRLIAENELDQEVTSQLQYKDGVKISCFLPDLLWFLKSKDRFKARPSWFNRFGIHDTIFSICDPLPFFGFLITSLLEFRGAQKARERK